MMNNNYCCLSSDPDHTVNTVYFWILWYIKLSMEVIGINSYDRGFGYTYKCLKRDNNM